MGSLLVDRLGREGCWTHFKSALNLTLLTLDVECVLLATRFTYLMITFHLI
ncbi:hypothetical protein VPHD81_0124 [Vibrio phage D81]